MPLADPVALTSELVRFETVNPPGEERACAQRIGQLLEAAGFTVAYYEFETGRTSLVARLDGSGEGPPICFTGHIDVVPLGRAAWSRDPFAGERDGDRLFGRGTTDMKAALAAIILAATRLASLPRKTGIELVFTAGEETRCEGSHHLAAQPGALGEAGAIVIGEPTANVPLVGHKGLVRYLIKTTGVTAHASMPEEGDNAIHKIAEVVRRLERFAFGVAEHPVMGSPTLNIGTITGGLNINSVPDEAEIGVDIRTIPGQTAEGIQDRLKTALGGEATVTNIASEDSVVTDAGDAWVQEVYDVMEPLLGQRPEPATAVYFTDGSVLKPAYGGPPTVILGPGEPTCAHKTDEYCSVAKLESSTEAYLEIMRRWCGV
ncbi:MAG: M20 family metallopeptidase [Vicinamibacterales bacterium]|jgi:succinyl-diaminopimelate desuccinylase|nr:acetylornithine deacetylase [Acidobacteriota bacterium]MDP6371162.1 M20 family metallopeptidase [Vicinamibacterales bacterium]MDP6609798.1 M20 family metallopeptidase [Vicinamibacterales bacterium]